jgi:ribosomal-protein-alanine N-acetyltransferase
MRYFPNPLSRAESDAKFAWLVARWARDGFSFGAVEVKGLGLVGFCGLNRPDWPPHLVDSTEIGWRFVPSAWGKGYATEAARAWASHGFGELGLDQIVAFAVGINCPSLAVMERLGMTRDPAEDFDDEDEPIGSPKRRIVLYRLKREDWTP